jgi:hypothetical protein
MIFLKIPHEISLLQCNVWGREEEKSSIALTIQKWPKHLSLMNLVDSIQGAKIETNFQVNISPAIWINSVPSQRTWPWPWPKYSCVVFMKSYDDCWLTYFYHRFTQINDSGRIPIFQKEMRLMPLLQMHLSRRTSNNKLMRASSHAQVSKFPAQ